MNNPTLRYVHLLLLALYTLAAIAVPARREPFVTTQPDGTTITLTLHGDENFHYLTDLQGNVIEEQSNGQYVRSALPTTRTTTRKKSPQKIAQTNNLAQHGLIILANFSNLSFLPENNLQSMNEMFNGNDYTFNGATGSARQYFIDQSRGNYQPQFDIVGPVTLPHEYAYYGANNRVGDEQRAHIAIKDACQIADTMFNIDFTKYDYNNDGQVDFVYVIYAGHNEAEGGGSNTIWPHAWNLLDAGLDIVIDGKQIATYACSSELRDNQGTERAGIGTFCHEFSHVLGLPDMYSTDNTTTHHTLGSWDIMDYGPYNNDGRTPPSYSAYERFFLGWTTPVMLNTPNHYLIKDIQATNACAIITQQGTSNLNGSNPQPATFFLLENRQQTSWDTYLPGHGLMITQIQYNASRWADNTVNNYPQNLGVDIIEACDSTPNYRGTAYDLFPAGANQYVPYTFYPILDINETDDGIVKFRFMAGGNADEPIDLTNYFGTDLNTPTVNSQITAVYTLTGQKILTNPTPERIKELQPAVYVITTPDCAKTIYIQKP